MPIISHDLVLTTYPLLQHDQGVLLDHDFHAVLVDEAQAIKSAKANAAKTAQQIKPRRPF